MVRSRSSNKHLKPAASAARPAAPQPVPQHQTLIAQKFHQGPLPPSEELANYDRISAGAAERIIAMAEQQAAHRRDLESRSLQADIDASRAQKQIEFASIRGPIINERLGTLFGGVVALACVGGAIFSATRGYGALVVGAFLCLPVASIIKAIRARPK